MKIGTVASVQVKQSNKTGKNYAVVTLSEVPNIDGITYPTVKVGDKIVYDVKLNIIGNIDSTERNK